MTGLTPDITRVAVVRHGALALTFADGLRGEVEVLDRMTGPVFDDARSAEGVREGHRRSGDRHGRLAGVVRTWRPTRSTSAFAPARDPRTASDRDS